MKRLRILLMAMLVLGGERVAGGQFLRKGDRVLCLGDSITQDGRYLAVLDVVLRTRQPGEGIRLYPLGLGSETVSGLSEEGHPFPRPCVLERSGRALEMIKPTVVMICYGMNDGIYAPPAEDRMRAYQEGMRELVKQCRGAGARVVLVTPVPFDAKSFRGPVADDGAESYGYQKRWYGYDRTLAGFSEWLVGSEGLADKVIDLHGPLSAVVGAWHERDPGWKNGDGIHPDGAVHWLMAGLIAEGLGVPGTVGDPVVGAAGPDGSRGVRFVCRPPVAGPAGAPRGFLEAGGFPRLMNRLELMVVDAPAAACRLMVGERLAAVVTREQLARGYDLTGLPVLPFAGASVAVMDAVMERQRWFSAAWRERVGHRKPGVERDVKTVEEAEAEWGRVEARLDELTKPVEVEMRVMRP